MGTEFKKTSKTLEAHLLSEQFPLLEDANSLTEVQVLIEELLGIYSCTKKQIEEAS